MGRALNGISIIGDEYLLCPVDYTVHTHIGVKIIYEVSKTER
jgi:hypothetical protein